MTTVALADATDDSHAAQPAAWGAIYAMTLCTFVLVASEFMPVSLLSPIADSLHLSAGQAGLLRRRTVLLGLAASALLFMGQFALYTYLRPFLEQVTHVGLGMLSTLLLVVGVAGFIGTTLIGRLIGIRLHLLLAAIPAIMAFIAIALALFGTSVPIVATLLAVWGLVGTAAPVGWWTWVTRAAPDHPEVGGGLMVAVVQFAIMSGATLGGLTYDAFGPRTEFLGSAVILVAAAAVAFVCRTDRAAT